MLDWGLGGHTHVFTCIETLRREEGRSLVRPVPNEDIGDDLMSIFWCKRIATSIRLQVDFGKEIPSHATSILIYISWASKRLPWHWQNILTLFMMRMSSPVKVYVLRPKVCSCYLVCFDVLQLQLIRRTQKNFCCISKFTMKHQQKSDWNLECSWFSWSLEVCVESFIGYIGLPNCIHYWMWNNQFNLKM